MATVESTRLSLVAIPTPVLVAFVRERPREIATTLGDGAGERAVRFPVSFAGDASKLFAGLLARREAGVEEFGKMVRAIVDRTLGTAVGNMGTHAPPVRGSVAIGYAIAPEFRGRGYATEMVRAFTEYLLARPDVATVTAETLATNAASMRVLEKSGFVRTGDRVCDEGPLVDWATSGGA